MLLRNILTIKYISVYNFLSPTHIFFASLLLIFGAFWAVCLCLLVGREGIYENCLRAMRRYLCTGGGYSLGSLFAHILQTTDTQ